MNSPRLRFFSRHIPPASQQALSQQRAEALAAYHILDTPAEAEFDQLTQLAASVCEAPISAISLLDRDRQWFKSRVGLDISETPVDSSFCIHALEHPSKVMVVPDTTADSRFRKSPMVMEYPHLRFYIGAPIVTPSGIPIGTICALDHRPRSLNQTQHSAMQCLAAWAATFLEQRRITAKYIATQKLLRRWQSFLPDGPSCNTPRPDVVAARSHHFSLLIKPPSPCWPSPGS